jgi:eukaryotic-like serine/threonine-protein kinase
MSDLDLPPEIAGRYRPIRVVGRGGMGVVYEVEHIHTGQRLALKVLTSQPGASVERFKREARATSAIKSDHIVRVTDADVAPELGGAPFLVMELLEGMDLDRATDDKPAPPEDVIEWLRQVARALTKAHDAGIIHRDLKPENLFLTRREDGTPLVKVLDFGIAKVSEGTMLTQSNQFLGTPLYMAPEQADPDGAPITARTDTYALGLIAFKLLMGKSYWKDGSLAQLLAQLLAGPVLRPSSRGSSFGPAFDAWFARACHRVPDQRFAAVDEEIEALAVALGLPERPLARSPDPPSGPRAVGAVTLGHAETLEASSVAVVSSRARRNRTRWMIGGLVVAGGAVAFAAMRGIGSGEQPAASALASALAPASAPALAPASAPTPALASALASAPAPASASASASAPASPAASVISSAIPRPPPVRPTPTKPPAPSAQPKNAASSRPTDPLGSQY